VSDGPRRILFAGDTHGDANHVRFLLDRAVKLDCQAVYVLGDFGIWNHSDQGKFVEAVSKFSLLAKVPVYFLPGNHDNYDLLEVWEKDNDRDEDGFVPVHTNVLYSPRGHRWTWGGVQFMSLGGAYSVDKGWRVEDNERLLREATKRAGAGFSLSAKQQYILRTKQYYWWRQEEITEEEAAYALRPGAVDVLLTHDKPRDSNPGWHRKDLFQCHANQDKIQAVVNAKRPEILLHGHLHYPYEQMVGQTWVRSLDCDPDASRHSGGTGDKEKSYTVMTVEDGKAALA
jgi:predicted phosphodiesterase